MLDVESAVQKIDRLFQNLITVRFVLGDEMAKESKLDVIVQI